ncbi:hypothetical protein CRG98_027267 [Punica granatum]|uniref:Sialate O-acetylesterase domain-containing protein n=1 Tax=Punica granatum TaxID=22663 RepID=A0A2I0J7W9_PUNGR|nr:hypothetical protein CRG98_027267 [Punica granatum]
MGRRLLFNFLILCCSLIIIFVTNTITTAEAAAYNQNKSTIKAFILAGQSNMVGHGGFFERDAKQWDQRVPSECSPSPAILRLDENNLWVRAEEPLHVNLYPLNENGALGVGPGMPFAHKLLQLNPDLGIIGLIPCARDESTIQSWVEGETNGRLVERATAAERFGAEISGLLWWQGGADAKSRSGAEAYHSYQSRFFEQVIIPPGKRPYSDVVREAQLAFRLPNLYKVDEEALHVPFNEDKIHVTTDGQVVMGAVLAETLMCRCDRMA